MRLRLCLPLVLVLALGVSANCSDEVDEPVDMRTSGSPDSTQTSSNPGELGEDGPPDLPAAGQEGTLEGAEAFVRHYIDLLNYASGTGDTKALAEVSDRECGGCFDGSSQSGV